MCISSALSSKLDNFFNFLLFLVRMVKHCEVRVIFQDIEHHVQENIFHQSY